MSWPWSELGLEGPGGLPEIREAYAKRLKTTHPEEDPEGFQQLHAAYQEASRRARQAARNPQGQGAPEEMEGEDSSGFAGKEKTEEPPEESPPWDYERLFAEGAAEAQAARRRKLEELRKKNQSRLREEELRRRAEDEEESWAAVMAAAQALELLHTGGAPLSRWWGFLESPVFLNVRANHDFVFALEDFLQQHPDLSPEIRRAIFIAYERQNGSKYAMYHRLYQLLNVEQGDRRRMARAKSGWRNAWRRYPPWRKAVIVVCFSILAVFFSIGWAVNLQTAREDFAARQAAKHWPETASQWLEEDFGEPFIVSGKLFAPAEHPHLLFQVLPYGERSDRWPGYWTNYAGVLVQAALEAFAAQQELELELGAYTGELGDAPGAYLFNVPFQGAEETIAALGELVDNLEAREWYQVLSPTQEGKTPVREPVEYQIFLCYEGLAFYDAGSAGGFDASEALSRYEQVGCAYLRYILEHSGLADKHMGEGAYVLQDQGPLKIGEGTFYQVTGADKDSGEARVQYIQASGGGMLFCIPAGELEGPPGLTDLYGGATSQLQVDKVGLVLVFDHVGPAQEGEQ